MARTRAAKKTETETPAETKGRTRAAKAEAPVAETKGRTRAAKAEAPAETKGRTRAAKEEAPARSSTPRQNLIVPKRRKAPAENTNDAVALLVGAALNANPDVDVITTGKANLLLMGAGLASSSAEAAVLVQKALKAGTIDEA